MLERPVDVLGREEDAAQHAFRQQLGGRLPVAGEATRYDKHPIVYLGGLVLAAVLLWLTDLGDTS